MNRDRPKVQCRTAPQLAPNETSLRALPPVKRPKHGTCIWFVLSTNDRALWSEERSALYTLRPSRSRGERAAAF